MKAADLRKLIEQTLTPLNLYTAGAEELLMATCANESNLGQFRTQEGGGPARGIFQMEKEDHDDIWTNFLAYHPSLVAQLHTLSANCLCDDMINNDPYAIAMCRIHYIRAPGVLPAPTDVEGIWNYYKQHYNTPQGAATHDGFMAKYHRYVIGQ